MVRWRRRRRSWWVAGCVKRRLKWWRERPTHRHKERTQVKVRPHVTGAKYERDEWEEKGKKERKKERNKQTKRTEHTFRNERCNGDRWSSSTSIIRFAGWRCKWSDGWSEGSSHMRITSGTRCKVFSDFSDKIGRERSSCSCMSIYNILNGQMTGGRLIDCSIRRSRSRVRRWRSRSRQWHSSMRMRMKMRRRMMRMKRWVCFRVSNRIITNQYGRRWMNGRRYWRRAIVNTI